MINFDYNFYQSQFTEVKTWRYVAVNIPSVTASERIVVCRAVGARGYELRNSKKNDEVFKAL